eukprot:3811190-Rhodomonas_salina.2
MFATFQQYALSLPAVCVQLGVIFAMLCVLLEQLIASLSMKPPSRELVHSSTLVYCIAVMTFLVFTLHFNDLERELKETRDVLEDTRGRLEQQTTDAGLQQAENARLRERLLAFERARATFWGRVRFVLGMV